LNGTCHLNVKNAKENSRFNSYHGSWIDLSKISPKLPLSSSSSAGLGIFCQRVNPLWVATNRKVALKVFISFILKEILSIKNRYRTWTRRSWRRRHRTRSLGLGGKVWSCCNAVVSKFFKVPRSQQGQNLRTRMDSVVAQAPERPVKWPWHQKSAKLSDLDRSKSCLLELVVDHTCLEKNG